MQNYTLTADEQLTNKENIEELFPEQLAIDLEIPSTDIQQTINEMDMEQSNSAAHRHQNQRIFTREGIKRGRSSRFPRKNKIRMHYFSSPKDGHHNIF